VEGRQVGGDRGPGFVRYWAESARSSAVGDLPDRRVDAVRTYGGPVVRRGHPDAPALRRLLLSRTARPRGAASHGAARGSPGTRGSATISGEPSPGESITHVLPLSAIRERGEGFSPSDAAPGPPGRRRAPSRSEPRDDRGYPSLLRDRVGPCAGAAGIPKPYSLYERILTYSCRPVSRVIPRPPRGERRRAKPSILFHQGAAVSWLPVSRESSCTSARTTTSSRASSRPFATPGTSSKTSARRPRRRASSVQGRMGARPRSVLSAGGRSALHRRLRLGAGEDPPPSRTLAGVHTRRWRRGFSARHEVRLPPAHRIRGRVRRADAHRRLAASDLGAPVRKRPGGGPPGDPI